MTAVDRSPHTFVTALRAGVRSLAQYPLLATVFLTTTLAQGALQGLLVWSFRWVLVRFTEAGVAVGVLAWGALLILGLWTLRALTTFAGEVFSVRLARRVEVDSLQRLLAKLLTLSVRFFERSSQGDLVTAVYRDLRGLRIVTLGLGTIVLASSRLLGLAVVAWLMSPKLALLGLVAVPLAVLPAYLLGHRITSAAKAERGTVRSLYDTFLQVVAGIRVVKVNRAEDPVRRQAARIGEDMYGYAVRQAQASSLARLLLESVSGVGLIAVLIVGGRDVAVGALDWQTLLSVLVAVMAVYAPVVNLLKVWGQVRQAIPHLERVDAVFAEQPELKDAPDARHLAESPRVIRLEDVSFRYDEELVLDRVSATFYRGETIGIVGPSGAGKSTLIGLLLRLFEPTAGRILLDGVDLRQIRHADLLEKCAFVPQEPFLFVDTVANNIRFTRRDASLQKVQEAAKAANVHDEILAMERGYETVVGATEDGRGISVGQKQRIAIAAALLKNAPILFLDEATSNLDAVSEHAVQRAVQRLMKGRTTFMIAHRLSTLRSADRMIVLDRGQLVGVGTHEELLRTCVMYRTLWESQKTQVGEAGNADGETTDSAESEYTIDAFDAVSGLPE